MRSGTRPQRAEAAGPSPAERFVLESFSAQVTLIGRLLADAHQLRIDGCAPVDVTSSTTLEYLLLSIRFAVKEHLQRGDDLLRLIELVGAILDAARGARPDGGKTDAGLHLLRGIAMAELLHEESRGRFARHEGLRELADAAMASLVTGFLARFGGELPADVRKAFPGFAAAMRDAWKPIRERRGLLLWLTQRG